MHVVHPYFIFLNFEFDENNYVLSTEKNFFKEPHHNYIIYNNNTLRILKVNYYKNK